ncbi:MAG: NAD(+) synthase [Roseburia sp.]
MRDGFVKVAAVTPAIRVADTDYNADVLCTCIGEAAAEGAKVIVLPELCITGYTCGDLFLQEKLLAGAKDALLRIAGFTAGMDAVILVGLPLCHNGKLYNVAAVISDGEVLGLVPKTYLPAYNEFYETRYFTRGMEDSVEFLLGEKNVPMGTKLLFVCRAMSALKIAVEICEDLWTPEPPGIRHARNGATLLVNLSASNEITGKDIYRRELVRGQSARLLCGYVYASAGDGESTQDVVYSGHNLIAENGRLLRESARFFNESIWSEIDVERLIAERRRMTTFEMREDGYKEILFSLKVEETRLTRNIDPMPFVPGDRTERERRCEEILSMQAMGLKKRLEHTNCRTAVVGISGGLDSTLALLVVVRAFDLLGIPHNHIKAVTMPGFGTTGRTYDNAVNFIRSLGTDFMEVDIKEAVLGHFRDIGQDASVHDVTYENAQARERTQILMDIANRVGGMVIGTGDLSELALGWATYNGDHMSMYAVNSSVPKTLVRHLVQFYADTCGDSTLTRVLLDVLDTPVSPELLPPEEGEISQKTEDIVGPYELHDFYLYHMLRQSCAPAKIYRLARIAFAGIYDDATILKWLKTFYHRFFTQQFKRSCLPDGPKVGSVAVSPRGDLRMPSDACAHIWLEELADL